MRFSIVIPVYNQYELLRQSVESIFHFVDSTIYDKIIVVNDHSDPNSILNEYLKYLKANPKVKVISFDDYRICFHNNENDKKLAEENQIEDYLLAEDKHEVSFGHGYSLWVGIKEVETDYVLCFDADSAFVANSTKMFDDVAKMFEDNEKIMTIGQIAGVMSDKPVVTNRYFNYTFGGRLITHGGTPGSPAFFCRMSGWFKDGIDQIASVPCKMAWVAQTYCNSIFFRGFYTANYPIMSNKYVFHAGGGILRKARYGRRLGNTLFGMCKDGHHYGGRTGIDIISEWYQGRHVLDMTSEEYERYLVEKYSKPFGEIQPPLDTNNLYVAPIEEKLTYGEKHENLLDD